LQHPFIGLFSRSTWISLHQKGKRTILDFTEDDRVATTSAGLYAKHLQLALVDNYASLLSLKYLQTGCSLDANQRHHSTAGIM